MTHQQSTSWEDSVAWTRVVAGCILYKDQKFLLVQERQPRAYGLWNLPAGHVDKGESIEQAAMREAREETGLNVALTSKIGVFHENIERPIKHVFMAHTTSGTLNPDPTEILDAQWLTYDEISALNDECKIRAEWVWEAINLVHDA